MRSRIVTHACQGAPSTTRCIETSQRWGISPAPMAPVRGHPAPPGALRQANRILLHRGLEVRERPAPSGALRRRARARTACTWCGVRERPAPSGAEASTRSSHTHSAASTPVRAPSTVRCIEARSCCPGVSWAWCQGAEVGRCRSGASCARVVSAPGALLP